MFEFGKRAASFIVASALILGGLVGCGPAEPTTAAEVFGRFATSENHDNYHADTTAKIGIEIPIFGNMNIDMDMAMDVAGTNSHGTMSMSSMGENIEGEIYQSMEDEAIVQYTKQSLADIWTKNEVETNFSADTFTNETIAKNAEFEKTDDGYKITIPGEVMLEALSSSGMDMDQLTSSMGGEEMKKAISDSKATLLFDKDCMLNSVQYKLAFEYDAADTVAGSDSGLNLSMKIDMDMSVTYGGYGSVDAKSVEVPDEVKKEAEENQSAVEELSSLLGEVSEDAETATETTDTAEDTAEDKAA